MKIWIINTILIFCVLSVTAQSKTMKDADFAHLVEKDYNKSLKLYQKEAELNPNNDMAFNGIGIANFRLGNFDDAIDSYNKGIELNEYNLTLYSNRANVYHAMGLNKLALEDLDFALYHNPDDAIALSNRGNVKFSEKDYNVAIIDFDRSIELDSLNPVTYSNRGVVYSKIGEHIMAQNDFNRSLFIDSTHAPAYENYAGLQFEKFKNYKKAIYYYQKAEFYGISNYALFINLGVSYFMEGEYTAAEKYCSEAISIDPKDAKGYIIRANSRAFKDNLIDALLDYELALKLDSLNLEVLTNRALFVYDKIGEYDKAISDILKVINQDNLNGNQSPFGYNNLGYFLYRIGNLDDAIESVTYSIELDPLNSYAFRNLGLIYLEKDLKLEACQNFEKAIQLGFVELYGKEILDLRLKACVK